MEACYQDLKLYYSYDTEDLKQNCGEMYKNGYTQKPQKNVSCDHRDFIVEDSKGKKVQLKSASTVELLYIF
ncbi:UNVERIFIED_CONTAM: hypothetical protein FKN15_058033 [Acipenser sinensis]